MALPWRGGQVWVVPPNHLSFLLCHSPPWVKRATTSDTQRQQEVAAARAGSGAPPSLPAGPPPWSANPPHHPPASPSGKMPNGQASTQTHRLWESERTCSPRGFCGGVGVGKTPWGCPVPGEGTEKELAWIH